ncbi:MAG: DUF166 family protein, partial [Promethearchaeota archaeon]
KTLVIGNNPIAEAISNTIKTYGTEISLKDHYRSLTDLPLIIEDLSEIIPAGIFEDVDLIICVVKSPALRSEIAEYALKKRIPIIIGTEHVNLVIKGSWDITLTKKSHILEPEVLCQLKQNKSYCNEFNLYIKEFGVPVFQIESEKDNRTGIRVIRGAPCGSTWKTLDMLQKNTPDDLIQEMGLKTQYNCFATRGITATGSTGKIYLAAKIHAGSLKNAFSQNQKEKISKRA